MSQPYNIAIFNANEIFQKIVDSNCVYNNTYEKIINFKSLVSLSVEYITQMSLRLQSIHESYVFLSPRQDWRNLYFRLMVDQYKNSVMPYNELAKSIKAQQLPIICINSMFSNLLDIVYQKGQVDNIYIHCFTEDKGISQFFSSTNISFYSFTGEKRNIDDELDFYRLVLSGDKEKGVPSILNALDSVMFRTRKLYIPKEKANKMSFNELKNVVNENKKLMKVVDKTDSIKSFPYIYINNNDYKERIIANKVLFSSKFNPVFVKKESGQILKQILNNKNSTYFESKFENSKICI